MKKIVLHLLISFFIFGVNIAHAQNSTLTASHRYLTGQTTDCTLTTGNWSGTSSSTAYTSETYIAEVILRQGTANREYYLDLYNDGGSTIIATATSTSLGGGNYSFTFPQHEHTTDTYDFVLRNGGYNTGWQRWSSSRVEPSFTFLSVCTNSTPAVAVFIATSTQAGGSGDTVIMISDILGNMTTEWTCSTDGSDTTCEATATTSVTLYNGPTFHEWIYIAGIIIFLLSFIVWSRMSILKKS